MPPPRSSGAAIVLTTAATLVPASSVEAKALIKEAAVPCSPATSAAQSSPPLRPALRPALPSIEELRARALAALNRGLPKIRLEAQEAEGAQEETTGKRLQLCSCLHRGGRCSCADDVAWLSSKRPEAPATYAAPHLRRGKAILQSAAAAEANAEAKGDTAKPGNIQAAQNEAVRVTKRPRSQGSDEERICTCLRRQGRCTCQADAKWLERKRHCVVPYVPPHTRTRHEDLEQRRAEIARKESEEAQNSRPTGPSLRTLAKRWEPQLEQPGLCRFNPLQTEGQVSILDADGLVAECMELSTSGQGIKALPTIQSGSFQFEVELLRDCSVIVGWSSAMSPPSSFDLQGFGLSSEGLKIHNHDSEAHGPKFGRAGDVIGAFLTSAEGALSIGFAVNGRRLGTAFRLSSNDAALVPMQPHISQPAIAPPLKLRLRGFSKGLPLKHKVDGFSELSEVKGDCESFCPFSQAVALASAERTAAVLTEEQMRTFAVPDSHIVELYDLPLTHSEAQLLSLLEGLLKLPSSPSRPLFVISMGTPDPSTALLAFRRELHASATLTGAFTSPLLARPLRHATAASRERLRELRGGAFRGHADASAARRLIHGSLQLQMPLAHLVKEKIGRERVKDQIGFFGF